MFRFAVFVSAMLTAASGQSGFGRNKPEGTHGQDNGTQVEVQPSRVRRTVRQVPEWLTARETGLVKDWLLTAIAQAENGFCWRDPEECPPGTYAWYDDGALIRTCVNRCPANFRDDGECGTSTNNGQHSSQLSQSMTSACSDCHIKLMTTHQITTPTQVTFVPSRPHMATAWVAPLSGTVARQDTLTLASHAPAVKTSSAATPYGNPVAARTAW